MTLATCEDETGGGGGGGEREEGVRDKGRGSFTLSTVSRARHFLPALHRFPSVSGIEVSCRGPTTTWTCLTSAVTLARGSV